MVGEDETWTRNIRRHCKTARVLLQYYRPTFLNAGRPPCFISLGPIKMLLGLRGGNSIDSKNPTQNPAMVLKLYTPKARFNAEMFFFWGYIKSIFWLFKAAKPCYLSDSSCRVVLQSYKVVASSAGFLMTLAAEYFCQNELAPSGKRDMINPGIAPISPSPSFLPSFLSLVLVSVRYPAERLRSFIYSCPASFILRPTEPTKEDPVRIALRRLRKEMEGLFLVSLHVKGPRDRLEAMSTRIWSQIFPQLSTSLLPNLLRHGVDLDDTPDVSPQPLFLDPTVVISKGNHNHHLGH